jgi:hypothetical protein
METTEAEGEGDDYSRGCFSINLCFFSTKWPFTTKTVTAVYYRLSLGILCFFL